MKTNLSTIGLLFVALWILSSCAPGVQLIDVEKRVAPGYQVELSDKSISIFASLDGKSDSALVSNLAQGLATSLEKRLSREEGSIFVFSLKKDSSGIDPDIIRDLSVESNSDLVFILSNVSIGNPGIYPNKVPGSEYHSTFLQLPFVLSLDVYDGITAETLARLSAKDTIVWEIVSRNELKQSLLNQKINEIFAGAALDIGDNISQNFFEKWESETRSLYYLFGSEWEEALNAAASFDWGRASEIWMRIVSSSKNKVAACAAYNLAVACEMQGNKDLALEWLSFSKKKYPLQLTGEYELQLQNNVLSK